ncbi:hypothetical protein L1994_01950 [Methanomicrobium antiquum]|uniref:Uncharacterized protein n=1 Tax=Methanomicrobium antiquum TaxID=487686 RepID=A0AAF0FVI2_9EURY|nr:hypothetical protein [Methanomicrobium antiquum]WFN37178.1 hypothetical protein L1994_01950 [Methanomicrobium antiquum]
MGDWNKAIAVFDEMKFPLDCNEFEDKIIAQKTICLLQLKGMEFNYPFGMYVRGSYSPAFTKDYYDHKLEFKNLSSGSLLSDYERVIVKTLDNLFLKNAPLLEIGATYAYIVKNTNRSPVEAFRIIKETKGFYRDTQIAKGISKAKEFLFEPTKKDLEWLKKETGPMQQASIKSMRH